MQKRETSYVRTQVISLHFNVFLDIKTQASSNDPEEELHETEPFLDDMEFESSQEVNEKLVDEDPPWTPEQKIELPESTHAKTEDDDGNDQCEKTR